MVTVEYYDPKDVVVTALGMARRAYIPVREPDGRVLSMTNGRAIKHFLDSFSKSHNKIAITNFSFERQIDSRELYGIWVDFVRE